MSYRATMDDLVSLHRDLCRRPEPVWCEFYTTARLVDELGTRDLDMLYVGPEILDADRRMVAPNDVELDTWVEQTREAGARGDVPDHLAGGYIGAVVVAERGGGSAVGLHVDIDALPVPESEVDDHLLAAEGFHFEGEDFMRTCSHGTHVTIDLGILDAVINSDFEGTFKLLLQLSEEQIVGGKAITGDGHLDGMDYLFAFHVGLDHPINEVVCGIDDLLVIPHFRAGFTGTSAHVGTKPKERKNANLGAATIVQNLYGIFRHSDGTTRVNVGLMDGGTITNIVAEEASIEGEVRGATTELIEYMEDRTHTVIESSTAMHDCEVEISVEGKALSAHSDDALAAIVGGVSENVESVTLILDRDDLGGSKDAVYLMQHVQNRGGLTACVSIGMDHPSGHHTQTFDVGKETIHIAVNVLAESVDRIAIKCP